MFNKTGVYKITNTVNGKVYVGSAYVLKKRKSDHFTQLKRNIHGNKHLQSAYNKYGVDAFQFEVLEKCSKDDVLEREDYWMGHYDSRNRKRGYNMKMASNKKGYRHTDEAKEKIRTSMKTRFFSKEHRGRISESLMGEKHPQYGKPAINRKTVLQYTLSGQYIGEFDSIRDAESQVTTGISACCRGVLTFAGDYIWMFDTGSQRENKREIKDRVKAYKNRPVRKERPVAKLDKTTGKVLDKYISLKIAANVTGVGKGGIGGCCAGRQKSAGGFKWKYL